MNTLSHLLMGRFLCEYLRDRYDIHLNKESFLFGNILPDYSPSFIQRPHFLENNITYLQKEIRRLLGQKQKSAFIGKNYSKHLGIICHYYADFFCFAHSRDFGGNMYAHIKYEASLHQYFREKYDMLKKINFLPQTSASSREEGVYGQFIRLHSDYLSFRPSHANDLVCSILACIEAILSITSFSVARAAEDLPLCYPNLKAI